MEPKQILSASFLDILFDNRNKAYGAYELRVTYPERIKKSLLFVFILLGLTIGGLALSNSLTPGNSHRPKITEVTLDLIDPDEPEPEKIPPPPEKQPEPEQVQTEKLTQLKVVDDKEVQTPPPTQEELEVARIDVIKQDGTTDIGIAEPSEIDSGMKIIEEKKEPKELEPFTAVEVEAKYNGNWSKFLLQNLNPDVPANNNAPAGRYQVVIQFVVDLNGKVSNIKALTSHGYGMEEEAIRVLRKATDWIPAFQNGNHVPAYRRQPIIFEVVEQ